MPLSLSILLFLGTSLVLYLLWERRNAHHEARAAARIEGAGELLELPPEGLHPKIDPDSCIGSGSCVLACPEKDILTVVAGRARVANPLACVGHGACAEACPVQAIELVFGNAKRGVELPKVDPSYQTTRPGIYVIGELSGMGLIANAIKQGRLAAEGVVAGSRRGAGEVLDAVVVGAGPSGISATLALMEAGLRVKLVDREAYGGTIRHYPRAKVVMTGSLGIPIYGQVKKRTMRKEELVELWDRIREETKLEVETGVLVEAIDPGPDEASYRVRTASGQSFPAANVLLALGRRGAPQKLGVPGEELGKVHYRLLEPEVFRGKHVLVVGGGNSAVESALSLAENGDCASVTISYRRGSFDRCRADNRAAIDRAIADGRVKGLLPSEVLAIAEDSVTLRHGEQEVTLRNDDLVVQIGGIRPGQILASFGVDVIVKHGEA
ncbi:MAG: NAD(P)-binding domain-containing protein [Polyangiales bacterium]